MKKITIITGNSIVTAELNNTATAEAIYKALPLSGNANVWGEEIYFEVPCSCSLEANAEEFVEVGGLAYWPTGSAFCIFFGRTPVSTDNRPRAYSAVNTFGKVTGNLDDLRSVQQGDTIKVERG